MLVVVEEEKLVARPVEVVRAQFVDMAHHARTGVHAALAFSDVRTEGPVCRLTARRRVLGMTQVDEIEVERFASGDSELRSVAGANAGLVIRQRFEAQGPGATRVSLRVELPARGWKALLAPLLKLGLRQDTRTALEEDRRDLEERGYPRPSG